MTTMVLDCETIPLITDEIRQEVADSIRVPGSYSKPDTIANWEAQIKPGLIEAELARGGLDATRGRLLSFSYSIDDDDPVCIMDEYEKTLLQAAMGVISDCPAGTVYVGFNHTVFDLPFIRRRAWANGLVVPRRPYKVKPWDDCLLDLMLLWAPDRDGRISLDKLCRVLGVPSPKANGFSGADVWPAYQRGDLDTIKRYALADVVATRECYRRMR